MQSANLFSDNTKNINLLVTRKSNMKFKIILLHALMAVSMVANAAINDRNYAVSENGSDQRIEVFNDGRNTYIQAVPGLIIKGATADGDRLIINGTPKEIKGWKDGKQITLSRVESNFSYGQNKSNASSESTEALNARLTQITNQLSQIMRGNAAGVQPQQPKGTLPTWEIRPDDLAINPTIRRWAKAAHWQVAWEIPVDFPVTITDSFVGTFEDAVSRVVSAYEGADYPLKACFYDNKVVRIVRFLGNGKECEAN